jgi:membrane protein DedA with SNARE-associated domain
MPVETLLTSYGYPMVVVGTMLEGESFLVAGAFLAHHGYLHLPWVIAAGFVGSIAVDQAFFYFGRSKGRAFLERRPHLQEKAARVRGVLDRHKDGAVVGFRFAYGLRTVFPLLIGASGYAPGRFLVLNALGGLLWAALVGLLGFFFGAALEAGFDDVHRHAHWIALGLVVAGLAFGGWRVWRRRA